MTAPAGRFNVAFDDPTWLWDPVWTPLDQTHPNLVTSYSIDRGRGFELDRTDAARATVEILDPDGTLDPTNPFGPYHGKIVPLKQACLCRRDPVAGEWQDRFRGWIGELVYEFDPSQKMNRLTVELIDIFEMLGAVEMQPGEFGDPPPDASAGQVFFDDAQMGDRILQVLGDALGPANSDYWVVFSGNVMLYEWPYSPGESPLTVIQEAADGEFPGIGNVYTDRHGRLSAHGRYAKFDPAAVIGGDGGDRWDFHDWYAGDGLTVEGTPGLYAQIRQFGFSRGVSKIINSASATPVNIDDADIAGQLVKDTASIGVYGIRSWSAQNLLTKSGLVDGTTALQETKRFAQYQIDHYAAPADRIQNVGFRSILPGNTGSAITWKLLSRIDISDRIKLTVGSPGGGGFTDEEYFVEGIHETARPATPEFDDVTLNLDLSPSAYYTSFPPP